MPCRTIYADNQTLTANGLDSLEIVGNNNVVTGYLVRICGNHNVVNTMFAFVSGHYNSVKANQLCDVAGDFNHVQRMPGRCARHSTVQGNHNHVIAHDKVRFGVTVGENDNCCYGPKVRVSGGSNNRRADPHAFPTQRPTENALLVPASGSRAATAVVEALPEALVDAQTTSSCQAYVSCPTKEEQLQQGRLAESGRLVCVICAERETICAAFPCMHVSYCIQCARACCLDAEGRPQTRVQCVKCRAVVKSFQRVYLES